MPFMCKKESCVLLDKMIVVLNLEYACLSQMYSKMWYTLSPDKSYLNLFSLIFSCFYFRLCWLHYISLWRPINYGKLWVPWSNRVVVAIQWHAQHRYLMKLLFNFGTYKNLTSMIVNIDYQINTIWNDLGNKQLLYLWVGRVV